MADEKLKHPWLALVLLIVVCFAVAGLGGLTTTPNIPNWYAGLAKPSWTPPGWLFGPVWSVLYLSMAVAAWLVWRKGNAVVPMTLFGVQLVFNAAWSWLFFGLHSPGCRLHRHRSAVGGHRRHDDSLLAAVAGGGSAVRAVSGLGQLRRRVELRHLAVERVDVDGSRTIFPASSVLRKSSVGYNECRRH